MASGSDWLSYAPIDIALKATAFALFTIGAVILFIWIRRTVRGRYFVRRDARAGAIRAIWPQIVSMQVPPAVWMMDPLDRQLTESLLLEHLDTADGDQLEQLLHCLRKSGLLDRYLLEAKTWRGWRRQRALIRLGRTRAIESIHVLAEALDSKDSAVVIAAIRGLGHLGSPEAMLPILQRMETGNFKAPNIPLKHALVEGCRTQPSLLFGFLNQVHPRFRELIAQTLGQIATHEMADDLAVLASDRSPEVRASAARALARVDSELSVELLSQLSLDETWFVRLRAVASLGQLRNPETIEPLVRCLCDTHRIVRQRAAMGLAALENDSRQVMKQVIASGDKYALHAYVSALQRTGRYMQVVGQLQQGSDGVPGGVLVAAAEGARRELRRTAEAQR